MTEAEQRSEKAESFARTQLQNVALRNIVLLQQSAQKVKRLKHQKSGLKGRKFGRHRDVSVYKTLLQIRLAQSRRVPTLLIPLGF